MQPAIERRGISQPRYLSIGESTVVDADIIDEAVPEATCLLRVLADVDRVAVAAYGARRGVVSIYSAVHVQHSLCPVIHSGDVMPLAVVYIRASGNSQR